MAAPQRKMAAVDRRCVPVFLSKPRTLSNFDPGMSMKEQKQVINQEMQQYREEKKKIQALGHQMGDCEGGFVED